MTRNRRGLDTYDDLPEGMRIYLRHNGYHFNRKAYEYACHFMYRVDNPNDENARKIPVKPEGKEKVDELLKKYNVTLKNDVMYDSAYLYTMAQSDFYGNGRSLATEEQVAKWIRDVVDDVDKPDGFIFNRWYADMCFAGIPIEWFDLI